MAFKAKSFNFLAHSESKRTQIQGRLGLSPADAGFWLGQILSCLWMARLTATHLRELLLIAVSRENKPSHSVDSNARQVVQEHLRLLQFLSTPSGAVIWKHVLYWVLGEN